MLTLYHSPQSRSSRIVWLLEEAGADYKLEYVAIPRMDGSGGPDPKNPHPEKKVPLLVEDGEHIWESAAICLYVADRHPKAELAPATGEKGRGTYLSWIAYYAGVIEPVINFNFVGLGDRDDLKRTFRSRAEVDARILSALKVHDYIAGDYFTAADILIASIGQWSRDMLPGDVIVDAYLERCNSRPALARAFAKDASPA